jgi:hypothetical protein
MRQHHPGWIGIAGLKTRKAIDADPYCTGKSPLADQKGHRENDGCRF